MSLYPPSPKTVPADYTEPSTRYCWEVVLVLACLLLTLVLYLGLVAGSGWVFYKLVTSSWPRRVEALYVFMRVLGVFCSGFLFLYLLKGLFKHQGRPMEGLVEITDKDQPEVFSFLRKLCEETGAPFPHRIYVSHEVNACVFYSSSILSLIFPERKNLLIGLGLVNALNLSELKALLAHELGHFSQSSMTVGSYVYVANKVLADVVYGRDFLDRSLDEMKTWDFPVGSCARIFSVVLGYLRMGMEAVFNGINRLNLSLLRQMEFNADRYSVKAAGSEVVGQLLGRCTYAGEVFQMLETSLWAGGDHKLYTKDVFAHLESANAALGRIKKDPLWGKRPEVLGAKEFIFKKRQEHRPEDVMWATHPADFDRERAAKDIYVPAETDERVAWLLFANPNELRQSVTARYYETVHEPDGDIALVEPAEFQRFLDDEYAETIFDQKYAGFYDGRYLAMKDLYSLPNSNLRGADEALDEIEGIHAELPAWTKAHRGRVEERERLLKMRSGERQTAEVCFEFRGEQRGPRDVDILLAQVDKELEEDRKILEKGDARIYFAYEFLAKEQGAGLRQDLEDRYKFQLAVQDMHDKTQGAQKIMQQALNFADKCGGEMSEQAFSYVVGGLQEAAGRLNEVLMTSSRFRIPALKNMPQGKFLSEFLDLDQLMTQLSLRVRSIEAKWIDALTERLGVLEDKLNRLHYKSLGALLGLQESIVAKWREKNPPKAEEMSAAGAP